MRPRPALLLTLLLAATSSAETPKNRPSECPYCGGEPARMERAGIVSHGGFRFATDDTNAIDAFLGTSDVRWIETEHFELGIGIGPYKLRQAERKKVRAELTRLKEVLPEVDPRAKVLDPWLRTHLYAQRVEDHWTRFLEVMGVTEDDFPDAGTQWMIGTRYMGEGPYLGQKGKYEVIVLPSQAVQVGFLREQFGLSIKKTQRWNVPARDSLIVAIHIADGDLRIDAALHNHIVFNLTINMVDGFKHYSYETPIWIREGLGHFLEREVSPDYNTFDSSEGGVAKMTSKSDWLPAVKRLINGNKAPRMAELVNLKSYAELELAHHYATWSMTEFLLEEHAEGYACLNGELHGRKGDDGYPDGSNQRDVHREAFKSCLGMSYPEFDQAWREWVLSR